MDFFGADIDQGLWALGLGAARAVPIVWLVPALGGSQIPSYLKLGIALALSLLCLPHTQAFFASAIAAGFGPADWILLLGREILVGFTVGFVASCVFRAAELAGRLIDTLRGANMSEVISPLSEGRTSPLGDLSLLLTTVIFFELGGAGHLATALARSYEGVTLAPQSLNLVASFRGAALLAISASAALLETGIGLAAPAVVALLLVDVALAAVARLSPQMPVFFMGMPIKALGGVGIFFLSIGAVTAALHAELGQWARLIDRAFALFRPGI